MLKYLSFLNIFFGITLFAISKSSQDYFGMAAMIPILLFNWITLSHQIKYHLKLEKWHLLLGYISVVLTLLSGYVDVRILFEILAQRSIVFGYNSLIVPFRIISGIFIIAQFILSSKADRKLA